MSKLLTRMRQNPAADWTIADVVTVCGQNGVQCRPPGGGGSHYTVSHATRRDILTIPRSRPIKPVYIRKLIRFLDAVGGSSGTP